MHRTLLVTDLVDSTALAARLGDTALAELSVRHDALARELLAAPRATTMLRFPPLGCWRERGSTTAP